jgi:hypothetical protein
MAADNHRIVKAFCAEWAILHPCSKRRQALPRCGSVAEYRPKDPSKLHAFVLYGIRHELCFARLPDISR